MNTVLYVGAIGMALLFGAAIVAALTKDRLVKKGVDALKAELADEEVHKAATATFQGRASHGQKQVTGEGALVLTARQLVFEMLMPKRRLAISLDSISNVDRATDLGPKAPALAVYFHDDAVDIDDVAVWLLNGVDEWVTQIRRARLRTNKGSDAPPWERAELLLGGPREETNDQP